MSEEKQFPRGIRWSNPRPTAPDFIKGQVSFKVDEFKQYLDENNNNGWVNLDLKESKKGNLYLDLNTFKPKKKETNEDEVTTNDLPTIDTDDPNAQAMLASDDERDY